MSEDFPRTLLELERRFSTEEACAEYLASLRWPGGWVCPRCAGADAWSVRRDRWLCDDCRYEMSVTAGTLLQDTHLPLTIWLRRHVADHQPKERHQRFGLAARSGPGQLQDRLGDTA